MLKQRIQFQGILKIFDIFLALYSSWMCSISILNPNPLLELSAAIGSKDLSLGAEVGFDTASASFTKYNAGIGLNKPDYSAAVLL